MRLLGTLSPNDAMLRRSVYHGCRTTRYCYAAGGKCCVRPSHAVMHRSLGRNRTGLCMAMENGGDNSDTNLKTHVCMKNRLLLALPWFWFIRFSSCFLLFGGGGGDGATRLLSCKIPFARIFYCKHQRLSKPHYFFNLP